MSRVTKLSKLYAARKHKSTKPVRASARKARREAEVAYRRWLNLFHLADSRWLGRFSRKWRCPDRWGMAG